MCVIAAGPHGLSWWPLLGTAVFLVLYPAHTVKPMLELMPWDQSGKCVTAGALRNVQQVRNSRCADGHHVCSADGQKQLHKI